MLKQAPLSPGRKRQAHFNEFEATELFCPTCNRAMPVRSRLLLVLPEGDKYEYLCARCLTSVGEKIDKRQSNQIKLII